MTIKEAIEKRHKVQKYLDKPLDKAIIDKINQRILDNNKRYSVNMKLVINDDQGLWKIMKLFVAKNVRNYIVLSGPERKDLKTTLGYTGIDIALYAQTLGLNTWWVGETYRHNNNNIANATSIIAIGYGQNQGIPHKSKKLEEVCLYEGKAPEWFVDGVKAALLAPTAMNKQKFMIRGEGNNVHIDCNNGRWKETDLGIIMYHFEIGAGKENFNWI